MFNVTNAVLFIVAMCLVALGVIIWHEPKSIAFALPALLVLISLGAFVLLMVYVATTLKAGGLFDASQPFGLPPGTVRAILTLSFIVLVGVFGSLILATSNGRETMAPLPGLTGVIVTSQDALSFVKAAGTDLIVLQEQQPDGKVRLTAFAQQTDFRAADDIAKTIMTILTTILTAMIGFYFGAKIDGDSTQRDGSVRVTRSDLTGGIASARNAAAESRKAVADARQAYVGSAKLGVIEAEAKKVEAETSKLEEAADRGQKLIEDKSDDEKAMKSALDAAKTAQDGLGKAVKAFAALRTSNPP